MLRNFVPYGGGSSGTRGEDKRVIRVSPVLRYRSVRVAPEPIKDS